MFEPAELVQIFVTADERHADRPLYEALFDACREHALAGATVLRDIEGFEDTSTITRVHWYRHEEPVALVIVDQPDRLDRFLAVVSPWILHGTIVRSKADVRRIEERR